MLFVWFSTRQAAPPAARATKAAGGLNNRLTVTVSTATSNTETSACGRLSNFIGAGRATVIPMFPEDIPFPPNSVSYLGENLTEGQYSYDLVSVCSNCLSANAARAYFSQSLPRAGWTQSALYPYQGDPTRACGDPYCWQQSSSPSRYISLEQVQDVSNGAASTYVLRLATSS
jgi:hypothetical protein